ncbi:hypothetical protein C8F04DRAFT_1200820 [Mycena alexandri]|uniref:Uncharacterized protein n=1 Tax=Mycena alexandri TaxID=1745969 RepID=A0AAD6S1M3_9AGAR|nr:hypothetical protein C8F04DRAFT_1200820 [Mycena alexandri]
MCTHHAQWPSRKILRIPEETALQRQAWRPERTRLIDRFYRLQPLQPRRALNCVKAVADPNAPPIVSPSTAFNRVKPVARTLNPDSFYRPSIASTLSRLITNPRDFEKTLDGSDFVLGAYSELLTVCRTRYWPSTTDNCALPFLCGPGMGKKSSEAQRAATARYRERNKVELKRKARERMAKRRAELKKSEEAWAAYSAKAREAAARYRAVNAKSLAVDQAARRSKRSIEKRGFTAWHQDYLKRNPRQPHSHSEYTGEAYGRNVSQIEEMKESEKKTHLTRTQATRNCLDLLEGTLSLGGIAKRLDVGRGVVNGDGAGVGVAVRPSTLGFERCLVERQGAAAGDSSLGVKSKAAFNKWRRSRHLGAVELLERRDDKGEGVLRLELQCWPKTRYFPQPGHENTFIHDARKDGRYFVVGAGHCGNGVFTDAHVADLQTNGFSGYARRAAKRWTGVGGVEEIWASFCDQFHQDGCHNGGFPMPAGWVAPTPVVRGCAAPSAPAPAAAPVAAPIAAPIGAPIGAPIVAPIAAPVAAQAPAPAPAPQTPRAKTNGSGNSPTSPFVVRSSVSPSPLRAPPQYHSIGPSSSTVGHPRTPLNPNPGSSASMSAGSSTLSAVSSLSSSSQALSSSSAHTPKKTRHSRVQSSPGAGYDTDFFYDDDTGESGPESTQTRFWAGQCVRRPQAEHGQAEVYGAPSLFPVSHIRIVAIIAIIAIIAIVAIITATIITDSLGITYAFSPLAQSWTPT